MQLLIGLVILLAVLFAAGGAWLVATDRVPARPRWLHHLFVRRRRGLLIEYPLGAARLLGVAFLLYCLGLVLLSYSMGLTLTGQNAPAWSQYGGWPLLIAFLISVYVVLRLRSQPPAT